MVFVDAVKSWVVGFVCDVGSIFSALWDGILDNPKDYQTLIGGSLAFLGVLLTLWVSGSRLRKQIRSSADAELRRFEREQAHKRNSIRGALLTELVMISRFMNDEFKQVERTIATGRGLVLAHPGTILPGRFYRFSMPKRDILYKALTSELSVLMPDELEAIITSYDSYYRLMSWLSEHSDPEAIGETFRIPEADLKELRSELDETRWPINSAVGTLGSDG